MKVKSKVFVVTGAGSGIGQDLTLALLKTGARVAAVDISESGLNKTISLAGSDREKISTHIVDITDRPAVEALPQAVLAAHTVVDGLINNAGIIQQFVRFKDLPYEEIEKMINVNFYGAVYMTKTCLPYLLDRPEAHIVNVSSMGGFLPVPGQTIYGAAKAAVKLFTEGLYSELLGTSVRVTVVFPGAVDTDIAVNSDAMPPNMTEGEAPAIKAMPAQDAAEQIIKGMEADRYRVLVGSDAKLMDFLTRLAPKQAAHLIYKQMGSLLK